MRRTYPYRWARSRYGNAVLHSVDCPHLYNPFQRFYIAAQGPLPNTVLHFWQMILQCDVHLIVMLTEVSEGGGGGGSSSKAAPSCMPYWPGKDGSTLELGGGFTILKKFSTVSGGGGYVTSTLVMTHKPTRTQRTIWHLQVRLGRMFFEQTGS